MANLSITTAWNETTSFVRREAGLILPIALLLIALPGAALQLAMPAPPPGEAAEPGLWMLLLPVVMAASMVGTVAISFLALRPGTSVGEALQLGLRRFIILFAAWLLLALGLAIVLLPLILLFAGSAAFSGTADPAALAGPMLLAFLIFAMLAIALWVRLMLMVPVAAAEAVGPIGIIRRSWELTGGHFWKLLGLVVLLVILAVVVLVAISAVVGIFVIVAAGQPEPGGAAFFAIVIVSALLQSLISAFFVTLVARIYAQLAGPVDADVFA